MLILLARFMLAQRKIYKTFIKSMDLIYYLPLLLSTFYFLSHGLL